MQLTAICCIDLDKLWGWHIINPNMCAQMVLQKEKQPSLHPGSALIIKPESRQKRLSFFIVPMARSV
jgi:hypothetical protein